MLPNTPFRLVCAALLCALSLLLGTRTALAQAQASTGQISGSVRDSQGGAVANATVKVTKLQTGLTQTTTTNTDGLYRFVLLPPGNYDVTGEASGFAKAELKAVTVAVGQIVDLAITLGVSAVAADQLLRADGAWLRFWRADQPDVPAVVRMRTATSSPPTTPVCLSRRNWAHAFSFKPVETVFQPNSTALRERVEARHVGAASTRLQK